MVKKIFILNGAATSGKNTFVDLCKEFANVSHYSYVDYARNVVAPLCGYDGGKTEKDRDFLSDLNDILLKYYDLPFNDILKQVDNFLKTSDFIFNPDNKISILFIDIREPEAIERACKNFNALSVLIENNRVEPVASNHADANIMNYNYDIVIENNGSLAELRTKAKTFCNLFTK